MLIGFLEVLIGCLDSAGGLYVQVRGEREERRVGEKRRHSYCVLCTVYCVRCAVLCCAVLCCAVLCVLTRTSLSSSPSLD